MEIDFNTDLANLNTFRMQVKAACTAKYYSVEELEELSSREDLPRPFLHIGGGSNLLFTKDFPGTVLRSRICFIQSFDSDKGATVRVGAGVPWDDFCEWCANRDLWGPENLSMIPGETGAAAVQNIGAYGREIADIISTVECYDLQDRKMVAFRKDQCGYGYRTSFFKTGGKGRYIVTAVSFDLKKDYSPVLDYGNVKELIISKCGRFVVFENGLTPSLVRKAIRKIREEKLPDVKQIGSAGSYFCNPYVSQKCYENIVSMGYDKVPHFVMEDGSVKIPAAWLIDKCGWKGRVESNAGVWEKQPLVLVNVTGKATPQDVLNLAAMVADSVKEKFGIALSPEVEII